MERELSGELRRNEHLLDSLRESGKELVIVVGPHEEGGAASHWVDAVLSVTGSTAGLPTVEDAIRDGLFEPGGRCYLVPYEEAKVSPERAAQIRRRTRYAMAVLEARRRGVAPPPDPQATAGRGNDSPLAANGKGLLAGTLAEEAHEQALRYAQNARLKFERVYEAARQALARGEKRAGIQKCRAALAILRETDLYGPSQGQMIEEIEARIAQIEGNGRSEAPQ